MPKSSKKLAQAAAVGSEMSTTKLYLILSFAVPFLIMGIVFIMAGVYPFGDRQVMYSDCKQQYLPFLAELQRKLQDGDSLLYSWSNGFGTNFMAMIAYYIASPLNILTLIIPTEYVREAMALFMMIKIGCAGLFTAVFLKYVYRRNDMSLVAFGCCYAFCDFIMGYYWDTIWLDSVAMLPLVALGVYCLVKEDKYRLYVISLAVAFVSSYYIGYMVCLFVVLWFVALCVKEKIVGKKLGIKLGKIAGCSALALAFTLPVTLTAAMQLSNTVGTDDTFPEKIETYNNFMELLANLISFHEPTTMDGLPNIGTGVICILLIVLFVRAKEIPVREKVVNLVLLGFMFISLNVNVLDYIWHAFHFPNQIPYRFAFIFSFVLVIIAYRGFTAFTKLDKNDIIGMSALAAVMICISVFYFNEENEQTSAVIGSLIVAAVYIFLMALFERELINRKMLIGFTSIVIIAEMGAEAYIGVNTVGTTSHVNYPEDQQAVTELVEYTEETDGTDFYRIEQTDYSTKNDGMIYGYNGIGQFSSTSYSSIIDFCAKFGLVSKRSSYQYLLTSPVTSMFLNVKYVIDRDGYTGEETSLTKVKDVTDEDTGNTVTLYENEYYLPIGYMSDSAIDSVDMDNDTVFATQNNVFKAATGLNEDVYTMLEFTNLNTTTMSFTETSTGVYSFSTEGDDGEGKLALTYTAPKSGMLYAWANVKSSTEVTVTSDSLTHTYNVESQRYIFPLGYYEEGEEVTVSVDATSDATTIICAAYLDSDILDEGYALLNDEGLQVSEYTSTKIEGTITVESDGVFTTSIPYEEGWTLYVDGEKTETKEVMGAFLAADLTEGTHEITLEYSPSGFIPGAVIALIALLVFVGLWVYDYVIKKKLAERSGK